MNRCLCVVVVCFRKTWTNKNKISITNNKFNLKKEKNKKNENDENEQEKTQKTTTIKESMKYKIKENNNTPHITAVPRRGARPAPLRGPRLILVITIITMFIIISSSSIIIVSSSSSSSIIISIITSGLRYKIPVFSDPDPGKS